jgi:2'-5' RNA ligase
LAVAKVAESAFIVRVPEAEAFVGVMRERCDPAAVLGVPAHITILMPFMSPERITTQTLSEARSALEAVRAFSFTLNKVARWPETTYLVPEPTAPFVQLTRAVERAFPEFPPYGGRHPDVVPHLTVADGSASRADEAEAELRAILARRGPIMSVCKTVDLFENSSGTWRFMHAITLDRSDG